MFTSIKLELFTYSFLTGENVFTFLQLQNEHILQNKIHGKGLRGSDITRCRQTNTCQVWLSFIMYNGHN